MTDLTIRTDAVAGETGSTVDPVAEKVGDEVEAPVVELHQLGRRVRDKARAAEVTAVDHLKLVE